MKCSRLSSQLETVILNGSVRISNNYVNEVEHDVKNYQGQSLSDHSRKCGKISRTFYQEY
jgi:hypothetical protein